MWLAAVSMISGSLSQFQARWQWLLTAGLVLEACVDLLVATSLCYFLIKSRYHSVHKRTIRLLDKLIAMTIRTGLITSVLSIIIVVCFLTMPEKTTWLAIMICQAKVFANSMLASLNGRSMLRDDQELDTDALGNVKLKPMIFNHSYMEFTTNINLDTQVTEAADMQAPTSPTV